MGWINFGSRTLPTLRQEFIYLAVLLDAFSRRCIGWALGQTLESELVRAALQMALAREGFDSASPAGADGEL